MPLNGVRNSREGVAPSARSAVGRRNERWGRSAEDAAAQWYEARGGRVLARRLRTEAGEVDLVVLLEETLIVVEVKARRRIDAALAALRPKDWARLAEKTEICAAKFSSSPTANDGSTDAPVHIKGVRVDLAAIGQGGEIQVIENAGMDAGMI